MQWNDFARPLKATVLVSCLTPSPGVHAQPNIIHIMIDDAGVGDFTSYWEDSPVSTPNIDALTAGGLKFTSAYAGATSCAPSRSVLLTGYHGGHTYLRSNNGSVSLRDQDVTIAEVLKTAGYATAGYGKWGVGTPGTPGSPERQGFDEFIGYQNQVHAHYHYPDRLYENGQALLIPQNNGFNEPETALVSDQRVHAHQIIYDRMNTFIDQQIANDQKFYVWGAWTPPHRRSTLPQSFANPGGLVDQYEANPGWNTFDEVQAGFVSWIDRQVGELRAKLDDPNNDGDTSDSVLSDTLIIFTSDNGAWENGGHNWDRNRETVNGVTVNLRGSKEGPYEGGLRTPMIAYWPGTIASGTSTNHITSFVDFLPTFAELAGAQDAVPDDIDGLSLAPTLTGVGVQQTHEGLYFEDYSYNDNRAQPEQAVRMEDFKLIRRHDGVLELFNLVDDPGETFNLIRSDRPASTAEHAAIRDAMVAWMDSQHVPITMQFNPEPPTVGNTSRDGVQPFGVRPGEALERAWMITGGGDARNSQAAIRDEQGDPIDLFIDDLHQDYTISMQLLRIGEPSPTLLIELVGDSGFVYYTATLETAGLAQGQLEDVSVDLVITGVSPTSAQAGGDLGKHLDLRITHPGAANQIFFNQIELAPTPQPADLDGDGDVDGVDLSAFFSAFTGPNNGPSTNPAADLDSDGDVDGVDLSRAFSAFTGPAAPVNVPEPASAMMLALGALALSRRRRLEPVRD